MIVASRDVGERLHEWLTAHGDAVPPYAALMLPLEKTGSGSVADFAQRLTQALSTVAEAIDVAVFHIISDRILVLLRPGLPEFIGAMLTAAGSAGLSEKASDRPSSWRSMVHGPFDQSAEAVVLNWLNKPGVSDQIARLSLQGGWRQSGSRTSRQQLKQALSRLDMIAPERLIASLRAKSAGSARSTALIMAGNGTGPLNVKTVFPVSWNVVLAAEPLALAELYLSHLPSLVIAVGGIEREGYAEVLTWLRGRDRNVFIGLVSTLSRKGWEAGSIHDAGISAVLRPPLNKLQIEEILKRLTAAA